MFYTYLLLALKALTVPSAHPPAEPIFNLTVNKYKAGKCTKKVNDIKKASKQIVYWLFDF